MPAEAVVERGFINFETSTVPLLAEDVATLASSVSRIYNARLSVLLFSKKQQQLVSERATLLSRYKAHFIFEELLLIARDEPVLAMEMFGGPFFPFSYQWSSSIIDSIYDNLEYYAPLGSRCVLHQASVHSPGNFSFEGIGEIVKQIREFVKDFWYRNNAEQKAADIENKQKELDYKIKKLEYDKAEAEYVNRFLFGDKNATSQSASTKLLSEVGESVKELKRLESEGKILDIPKYIEIPEQK